MADADEPHAPGPTSDSTSDGLHPLTVELLARHDRRCAPTATALSKRPADWPAADQERAAVRIRGAAPRMANLEPVEKTAVVSDSTGADAAPAIRARPTRSSSAQLALEPTALLNRLETMLLGNQPVPAPSNEVSIVGEVTNGIIIAAKAAVNTLFLSQRRGALMALQIKNLKKAALAYLVWDLRGELAGARLEQAVVYGKRLETHASGVDKELGKCKRRQAGAEALLAVVPETLQDVPTPEEPAVEEAPAAEDLPASDSRPDDASSDSDRESVFERRVTRRMIDAGLNEAQFDDMRDVYGIQLAHEDKCAILLDRAACFEKLYYSCKAKLLPYLERDWVPLEEALQRLRLVAARERSGTVGRGYDSDITYV